MIFFYRFDTPLPDCNNGSQEYVIMNRNNIRLNEQLDIQTNISDTNINKNYSNNLILKKHLLFIYICYILVNIIFYIGLYKIML